MPGRTEGLQVEGIIELFFSLKMFRLCLFLAIGWKVFIVDGSEIIRERLVTLLSEIKEIEIIGPTADAVEATKFIFKSQPDAAILDIYFPRLSGMHVLRYIKEMKPTPMVIILTNHSYPQYREKCLQAGAEFFFDKSTEFQKVRRVEVKKWRS